MYKWRKQMHTCIPPQSAPPFKKCTLTPLVYRALQRETGRGNTGNEFVCFFVS